MSELLVWVTWWLLSGASGLGETLLTAIQDGASPAVVETGDPGIAAEAESVDESAGKDRGQAQAGSSVSEYLCRRLPARPAAALRIDGRLEEPLWQQAEWSAEFMDIEGVTKPRPKYSTRMKMLWDDECLYIAAELQEPHVWGNLTRRDSIIFHDNDFEVFLDPEGDGLAYGELELNALNTVWDLRLPRPYRDGGQADDGWTIPGLRTGVSIQGTLNDASDVDQGWTIEIAIPWAGLETLNDREKPLRRAIRDGSVWRGWETFSDTDMVAQFKDVAWPAVVPLTPREGTQWRINFSRVEWPHEVVNGRTRRQEGSREDNWVWSPQGVVDMHRPETWGILRFTAQTVGSTEPVKSEGSPGN